jgi:hypothetical protein
VQWRNGNARICNICPTADCRGGATSDVEKRFWPQQTPTISSGHSRGSRINTTGKAPVARMDRPAPSKRMHAGSNPARSTNLNVAQWRAAESYSAGSEFESPRRAQYGELSRQGREPPAERAVPSRAWGSCPQLSATRVWHRRMCIGLPNRPGGFDTRGPLHFALSSTLVRMRLFQSSEAGSSPAGGTMTCRGAGAA